MYERSDDKQRIIDPKRTWKLYRNKFMKKRTKIRESVIILVIINKLSQRKKQTKRFTRYPPCHLIFFVLQRDISFYFSTVHGPTSPTIICPNSTCYLFHFTGSNKLNGCSIQNF